MVLRLDALGSQTASARPLPRVPIVPRPTVLLIVERPDSEVGAARRPDLDTLARDLARIRATRIPDDGHEIPIAIRHPDGVVLFTVALRAHRRTLTAILPPGGVVREVEDTGEVAASWRLP